MNLIRHIERLEKIDKLVRENKTGTPHEFAEKVGISRRQLYNYIEELRSYGIEIRYSRKNQNFHFENNRRLKINFNCKVIEAGDQQKTSGGVHIYSRALEGKKELLNTQVNSPSGNFEGIIEPL